MPCVVLQNMSVCVSLEGRGCKAMEVQDYAGQAASYQTSSDAVPEGMLIQLRTLASQAA